MQCLQPLTIKNPAYMKKPDQRPFVVVPCNKCLACLSRRASSWANRLLVEDKHCVSSWFVTLTYSDENLPVVSTWKDYQVLRRGFRIIGEEENYYDQTAVLVTKDFQDFFRRLRHISDIKFKYYLAAEYGSKTYRPHAHVVLFCDRVVDRDHLAEMIGSAWSFGMTRLDTLSPALIRYATKYICKTPSEDNYYRILCDLGFPQFSLMSKKLGIAYLEDAKLQHSDGTPESVYYLLDDGTKSLLPRYYRDKLYDDTEKKRYAEYIQDKQGIPFDASDGELIHKYVLAQRNAYDVFKYKDKQKKERRNKL